MKFGVKIAAGCSEMANNVGEYFFVAPCICYSKSVKSGIS